MTYYPPKMNKKAFTCPHCNAYSQMIWSQVTLSTGRSPLFLRALCNHCGNCSYWFNEAVADLQGKMFYPISSNVPMPHEDMPEHVRQDYIEARGVLSHSSRASAALLRLALQKLCIHLGKSENINRAIGELVADGLPQHVQMAFDSIRIIGNESVHPGEITDEHLDSGVAQAFDLMNFIIQDRITRFQQARELYESLPEAKLEGVRERDKDSEVDGSGGDPGAV